jgi:hypothetical protein
MPIISEQTALPQSGEPPYFGIRVSALLRPQWTGSPWGNRGSGWSKRGEAANTPGGAGPKGFCVGRLAICIRIPVFDFQPIRTGCVFLAFPLDPTGVQLSESQATGASAEAAAIRTIAENPRDMISLHESTNAKGIVLQKEGGPWSPPPKRRAHRRSLGGLPIYRNQLSTNAAAQAISKIIGIKTEPVI